MTVVTKRRKKLIRKRGKVVSLEKKKSRAGWLFVLPFIIGLIVILIALLFLDRKALKDVDYGLLLTFVAFFIFAGNMSRISLVQEIFNTLLQKNTLLVSALSCQMISNVPSAILLSQFTENYTA